MNFDGISKLPNPFFLMLRPQPETLLALEEFAKAHNSQPATDRHHLSQLTITQAGLADKQGGVSGGGQVFAEPGLAGGPELCAGVEVGGAGGHAA